MTNSNGHVMTVDAARGLSALGVLVYYYLHGHHAAEGRAQEDAGL